jgi:ABC-type Mn2+/Zn2+ transport system ATPase subunit
MNSETAKLTNFQIDSLHGRPQIISLPLVNNQLILVGENGTGKSTVVNILYYLLTQQWHRISEFKFDSLKVEASGEVVELTRDDIETLDTNHAGSFSRDIARNFPPNILRRAYAMLGDEFVPFDDLTDSAVDKFSDIARIPRSLAKRMLEESLENRSSKLKKPLLEQIKRLQAWKFGQFLYLPTYRRIEQDLKSIFRGIEIEEKVREFRERFRKRERTSFIELVEFGMEDVEKTIQSRMAQIKESVRTGLSTLTGTYLREVIRGLNDKPDISVLRSIDPTSFQSMFARIDEQTLPTADKLLLQTKIKEISQGSGLGPDDKVIAHFLSKLVVLYKEQRTSESDVRDFVDLCNLYLTGKQFVYDDAEYEIYIELTQPEPFSGKGQNKLPLRVLSSGEKQIVSLFSHMYLSGERDFFLVIDEPELSLSVPWQQRFLPDIVSSGRCTGIVAVTHSPFIWENDLEPRVLSLAEHIRDKNDIH